METTCLEFNSLDKGRILEYFPNMKEQQRSWVRFLHQGWIKIYWTGDSFNFVVNWFQFPSTTLLQTMLIGHIATPGWHYTATSDQKLGYFLCIKRYHSRGFCVCMSTPKLKYDWNWAKTHNWSTGDHVNAVIKCTQLLLSWLTSCSFTICFTITHWMDCIVLWPCLHFYLAAGCAVGQRENKPNCTFIQVNRPDEVLPQRNYSLRTLRRIDCPHDLMISK